MEKIVAKKIDLPPFAREPIIDIDDEGGEEARRAFEPFFNEILEHIHKELERSFNDPNLFFLNEEEGFPLRNAITGEYYIADISYEYDFEDEYSMWINLHCLCNENEAPDDNRDYVCMEMGIYLDRTSNELSYEEEFTNSAI